LDVVSKTRGLRSTLLWFAFHIDALLSLTPQVLSLISLEWLRYLFGGAPMHFFNDELHRFNKALDLYLKIGPSEDLFASLFEGIDFGYINVNEMLEMRCHPVFSTDNDNVIMRVMESRTCSLDYVDLGPKKKENGLRGCATVIVEID
jgi:hypothetical protein